MNDRDRLDLPLDTVYFVDPQQIAVSDDNFTDNVEYPFLNNKKKNFYIFGDGDGSKLHNQLEKDEIK